LSKTLTDATAAEPTVSAPIERVEDTAVRAAASENDPGKPYQDGAEGRSTGHRGLR
jgi:hypothetical protein